jgi:hypothetical protein
MANHCIRSGLTYNGDGTTWASAAGAGATGAFNATPTTWTRGDTYYYAGGTYGGPQCTTALSGTTYIYIYGATVADHGTATGWDNSYAVSATQATFNTDIAFSATGYFVMDGKVGSGITKSSYGFVGRPLTTLWFGNTITDIQISHLVATAPIDDEEKFFAETYWTGTYTNLTFSHCLMDGYQSVYHGNGTSTTNCLLEYNIIENGFSSGSHHGAQFNADAGTVSGIIIRYNQFLVVGGPCVEANNVDISGIEIYGNTFYACDNGNGHITGTGAPGDILHSKIYNNTFVQCTSLNHLWFWSGEGTPTDNIGENNLFYDMESNAAGLTTADYNAYFDTTYTPTETHGQVTTGDPFVNSTEGDYHLAANTSAGVNLGSPYDIDLDSVTRTTWSRGAYEYVGGGEIIIPAMAAYNMRRRTQ